MGQKVDQSMPDEMPAGCERPEGLLGEAGLVKALKKALMERMRAAEVTDHLGHVHGQEAPPVQSNRRNGITPDGGHGFTPIHNRRSFTDANRCDPHLGDPHPSGKPL